MVRDSNALGQRITSAFFSSISPIGLSAIPPYPPPLLSFQGKPVVSPPLFSTSGKTLSAPPLLRYFGGRLRDPTSRRVGLCHRKAQGPRSFSLFQGLFAPGFPSTSSSKPTTGSPNSSPRLVFDEILTCHSSLLKRKVSCNPRVFLLFRCRPAPPPLDSLSAL